MGKELSTGAIQNSKRLMDPDSLKLIAITKHETDKWHPAYLSIYNTKRLVDHLLKITKPLKLDTLRFPVGEFDYEEAFAFKFIDLSTGAEYKWDCINGWR